MGGLNGYERDLTATLVCFQSRIRLEARLLGHDADSEDCLVRCLSCHKEVVSANAEVDAAVDAADDDRSSYMKKANSGPSSGKIYRSNVPLSAQLVGAYGASVYACSGEASGTES